MGRHRSTTPLETVLYNRVPVCATLNALIDAAEGAVSAILIDVDSPGRSAFGIGELADEIYRARACKPIAEIADSLATNAAYWIAASASEFHVTPGGEAGSIGVFAARQNLAKALESEGVESRGHGR